MRASADFQVGRLKLPFVAVPQVLEGTFHARVDLQSGRESFTTVMVVPPRTPTAWRPAPRRLLKPEPYTRVLGTVKSEGSDHYRSFWRNERTAKARSKYLDHFALAVPSDALAAADSPSPHADVASRIRRNAMDFDDADLDLDGGLDFDEFSRLMRTKQVGDDAGGTKINVLTDEMLNGWFRALDRDGNGQITKAEYFSFAVREAAMGSEKGRALTAHFEAFDTNRNGVLEAAEFKRACGAMGFAEVAPQLLAMLDSDASGTVDYAEVSASAVSRGCHSSSLSRPSRVFGRRLPSSFPHHRPDSQSYLVLPSSVCHTAICPSSCERFDADARRMLEAFSFFRSARHNNTARCRMQSRVRPSSRRWLK